MKIHQINAAKLYYWSLKHKTSSAIIDDVSMQSEFSIYLLTVGYKCYNPYKLSSKSKISVWWKCKNGHDFKMSVKKMVQNNCCPKC